MQLLQNLLLKMGLKRDASVAGAGHHQAAALGMHQLGREGNGAWGWWRLG